MDRRRRVSEEEHSHWVICQGIDRIDTVYLINLLPMRSESVFLSLDIGIWIEIFDCDSPFDASTGPTCASVSVSQTRKMKRARPPTFAICHDGYTPRQQLQRTLPLLFRF